MTKFLERMLELDPKYGTQDHQRRFIDRMVWLQANHPCTKGCVEHDPKCYPKAALDAAVHR